MENTDKSGPEGAWTAPEGARGDGPETAEASGNVARSAGSEAAAPRPLAPVGAGLRSAALLRLLDGDGASDSDASGSASAGAPSPAPSEFAGAAPAGTPAKLGPIASANRAAQAWGARHAKASEDRRGQ